VIVLLTRTLVRSIRYVWLVEHGVICLNPSCCKSIYEKKMNFGQSCTQPVVVNIAAISLEKAVIRL